MTGARLLYSDDTIQHAGLVFYGHGHLSHMFYRQPDDGLGPLQRTRRQP